MVFGSQTWVREAFDRSIGWACCRQWAFYRCSPGVSYRKNLTWTYRHLAVRILQTSKDPTEVSWAPFSTYPWQYPKLKDLCATFPCFSCPAPSRGRRKHPNLAWWPNSCHSFSGRWMWSSWYARLEWAWLPSSSWYRLTFHSYLHNQSMIRFLLEQTVATLSHPYTAFPEQFSHQRIGWDWNSRDLFVTSHLGQQ